MDLHIKFQNESIKSVEDTISIVFPRIYETKYRRSKMTLKERIKVKFYRRIEFLVGDLLGKVVDPMFPSLTVKKT